MYLNAREGECPLQGCKDCCVLRLIDMHDQRGRQLALDGLQVGPVGARRSNAPSSTGNGPGRQHCAELLCRAATLHQGDHTLHEEESTLRTAMTDMQTRLALFLIQQSAGSCNGRCL